MRQNNPIEKLTEQELSDLIETLEGDLASMPAPDFFDWDGARGFYEATLEKARTRLDLLRGSNDPLLTSGEKSV